MIAKIALTFFGHCKVPKVDLEKSHLVEANLLSQESSESFSVFFVDKHDQYGISGCGVFKAGIQN